MQPSYTEVTEFDSLLSAYYRARRGKRYRHEVARYSASLEENLINLQNHLQWHSWRPAPPREFVVTAPKMRVIQAPSFEDRIVHHALVHHVEPLFERRFIYHSYGCRKGKGVHAGVRALQGMMRKAIRRWPSPYIVQIDVSKFFASIQHSVALRAVERTIEDDQLAALFSKIFSGYGHDSGLGLPVGALTSQLIGNAVLDAVDHEMTDQFGAGLYLRYMDDIIIVCKDKAEAKARFNQAASSIASQGLVLNPKSQIRPVRAGVDWCGYRTWATHILPRKRNMKRIRKRVKNIQSKYKRGEATLADARQVVASMMAYTKHCDAHNSTSKILENTVFSRG